MIVLAASSVGVLVEIGATGATSDPALPASGSPASDPLAAPHFIPNAVFVAGPPPKESGADDITEISIPDFDHGHPVIFTEYQNRINPIGTPSSPGGPTQGTVAGYDEFTGQLVGLYYITGHVDGVTADPAHRRVVVTSNEDANSAFYLINHLSAAVIRFTCAPTLEVNGNGGSDSIAIWHGGIFSSHSNPNDTYAPTVYRISLDWNPHVDREYPVFWDDSPARFEAAGTSGNTTLTDPDTSYVMPPASPPYGGDLATISQVDGRLIFARTADTHLQLTQLNLTDNVSGNLPRSTGSL
ncbi:MAG: hypothetical protein ACREDE_01635 [Thermoplasmata archaeon]